MRETPHPGQAERRLPRMGELSPDAIKPLLRPAGGACAAAGRVWPTCWWPPAAPVRQVPAHRRLHRHQGGDGRLAGRGVRVMGDIGCYSLGALEPLAAIHSCLCMGSSIGMAIGAAHAGMTPALCVIGDGTFTHSGHGAAARRGARERERQGLHPRQRHRRDDRRPAHAGHRRAGGRPGGRPGRAARAHPRGRAHAPQEGRRWR
jgi:hypothetical protein